MAEDYKEDLIAYLETLPPDDESLRLDDKTLTPGKVIEHVREETEIGLEFIKMYEDDAEDD